MEIVSAHIQIILGVLVKILIKNNALSGKIVGNREQWMPKRSTLTFASFILLIDELKAIRN